MTRRLTTLPRDARDTLFLLAVIAWIVVPLMGSVPLWCSAMTAAVLLWRGLLAVQNRPLPPAFWRRVLLLGAVVGTIASHRTILGQESGTTLLVVLLALKTLELRARRDALVIFFLGFFVLLTHFFDSQSMPRAAITLIGLLGLLTALVNAHRPVGRPSLRESARCAARMVAVGAPLMLVLFVFFPRFAPLWGVPGQTLGKTGLSSRMEVGTIAELALDDAIAMRIKFDGPPPPQSQLYFRGPVLTRFEGRTWTTWGGGDGYDANFFPPREDDLQLAGEPVSYEVTLEPSRNIWLLALDIAPEHPELPGRMRARHSADHQWMTWRPINEVLRYRATSWLNYRYGLLNWSGKPISNPQRELRGYLQLPDGLNPRTRALGEDMRQRIGSNPQAIVDEALAHLRSGGYSYTLEPGAYGQHTADEFWFDKREGFCEHIASAFAVLMRAAGVPARIVTGFQGGEVNNVDGYWTLRNSDAHAWTEIWLAERGWMRVDPTGAVFPGRIGQTTRLRAAPGLFAGAVSAISPTLLARLRDLWEAIDNRWTQWVLNYTQTRQFDLMRSLGFDTPDWRLLVRIIGALLACGALAVALWLALQRRRQDPWQRLLAATRRRLAAAGISATPATTPRALVHATRTAAALPAALRQPLAAWLLDMERHRYAPANAGESRRTALRTLARRWRALPWRALRAAAN
ncbi:MAG: DUF3488 domain-containing transglutaminase family protein [Ottowia sp.]|nr:DUF3488 domain-containing transglutaminase family protein [Ottowia sp.]